VAPRQWTAGDLTAILVLLRHFPAKRMPVGISRSKGVVTRQGNLAIASGNPLSRPSLNKEKLAV